jgi:hypothetical protein
MVRRPNSNLNYHILYFGTIFLFQKTFLVEYQCSILVLNSTPQHAILRSYWHWSNVSVDFQSTPGEILFCNQNQNVKWKESLSLSCAIRNRCTVGQFWHEKSNWPFVLCEHEICLQLHKLCTFQIKMLRIFWPRERVMGKWRKTILRVAS